MSKMSELDALINDTAATILDCISPEVCRHILTQFANQVLELATLEVGSIAVVNRQIDQLVDALIDSPETAEDVAGELVQTIQEEIIRRYSDRLAETMAERLRKAIFDNSTIM